MVVLKKLRASTLMETMVATVLIVIVFMIASLVMNSLIRAQSLGNTQPIKERIRELEYSYISNKLILPYFEDIEDWEISVSIENEQGVAMVVFEATQATSKKEFNSKLIAKE